MKFKSLYHVLDNSKINFDVEYRGFHWCDICTKEEFIEKWKERRGFCIPDLPVIGINIGKIMNSSILEVKIYTDVDPIAEDVGFEDPDIYEKLNENGGVIKLKDLFDNAMILNKNAPITIIFDKDSNIGYSRRVEFEKAVNCVLAYEYYIYDVTKIKLDDVEDPITILMLNNDTSSIVINVKSPSKS